jgi:hypothetical protein
LPETQVHVVGANIQLMYPHIWQRSAPSHTIAIVVHGSPSRGTRSRGMQATGASEGAPLSFSSAAASSDELHAPTKTPRKSTHATPEEDMPASTMRKAYRARTLVFRGIDARGGQTVPRGCATDAV